MRGLITLRQDGVGCAHQTPAEYGCTTEKTADKGKGEVVCTAKFASFLESNYPLTLRLILYSENGKNPEAV